jgi:hypothetical protein
MLWNIFSAPELAEPVAPDEAPLDALSPAATAASGNAKAAATDAIRVFLMAFLHHLPV